MILISGAQYKKKGLLYRLLGVKSKVVVFQSEIDGRIFEELKEDAARFIETGVHNHENYCCRVHNIHVSPHRGCVLR